MQVALDQSAFHNPIWVTPPAPPPEPKKAPTPPPTKLQLLALSNESGVARAVLYDPDSDRVITVSVGDKVASSEVKNITRSGVVIADASGSHDLRLDPGGRP